MTDTAVSRLDEAAADAAISTIVLSFTSDPAGRWTWPNSEAFLRNMPLLARAFAAKAFALGTAYGIEDLAGVALWLPPGEAPDEEAMGMLVERTGSAAARQDAGPVFEQMGAYHPQEPHWYLALIGVDPAHQGRGLGDRLMTHALARCDTDGLPAYLESSNARNLPFYRRHGFVALGEIQSGSSPTIVPMLRRPK